MLSWLRRDRLAARKTARPRIVDIGAFPGPIYAIGDIHGQAKLLRRMEAMIEADRSGKRCIVITLGDHVDRGPDSARVLDLLIARSPAGVRRICLRGNHEEMMLDFMSAPRNGHPWLTVGGCETLASYGISAAMIGNGLPRRSWRQVLDAHVPAAHLAFLERLPEIACSVREVFVHAGADPDRPLEEHDLRDLLWRRAHPPDDGPALGRRVVHGHIPTARVEIGRARISVDTGAGCGGALSAVVLHGTRPPRVLSTLEPRSALRMRSRTLGLAENGQR